MHHCRMAHAPAYVDMSLLKTLMYILHADDDSPPVVTSAVGSHQNTLYDFNHQDIHASCPEKIVCEQL